MTRARMMIAVTGAFLSASSFWMSLPLIAVALRARGVSDFWVGVISGLPWAGLLAVSPFIPWMIRRHGLQRTVLAGMAMSTFVFIGFACTDSVAAWSILFVFQGCTLALRWAAMDTWINGAVPDESRGRLIGLYELLASGSMAAGPACLVFIGSDGRAPFLICAVTAAAASLMLLCAGRETAVPVRASIRLPAWRIWNIERPAFIGITLVGLIEACNLSLLPLFSLGSGAPPRQAALFVVMVQAGAAAGAVLFGFLADKFSRRAILAGTGIVTILAPLLLPSLSSSWLAWPLLAAWGLAQGGLFTLGMVMLGARFQGLSLAPAVALAMAVYTLGGIIGPPCLGSLMAAFGPLGLPYGLAAISLIAVGLASCFEIFGTHVLMARIYQGERLL